MEATNLRYIFSIEQSTSITHTKLHDEKSAKPVIKELLGKFGYIVDVDEQFPDIKFCSIPFARSVRPDFLLLYAGDNTFLPPFIPVELDISNQEIKRHLQELLIVLPVHMEVLPKESERYVLPIIDRFRSHLSNHNVILAPFVISHRSDKSNKQVISQPVSLIRLELLSLHHHEIFIKKIYDEFLRDIEISLINLIIEYPKNTDLLEFMLRLIEARARLLGRIIKTSGSFIRPRRVFIAVENCYEKTVQVNIETLPKAIKDIISQSPHKKTKP